MKQYQSITKIYNTYSGLIAVVLILSMLALFYAYSIMKELNDKFESRYISYQLADELRQSSDDLTRMARTFVVTGDPRYEKAYFDILNIRNGKTTRPEKYNQIYWDLVTVGDTDTGMSSDALSLKQMMKNAGFTEEEFAKLQEAENNSNDLVVTETVAMNAIKNSIKGSVNPDLSSIISRDSAITMMHDLKYHQDKYKIMKPIDDFFDLLDARTLNEVVEYREKNNYIISLMIIFPVIVFVLLIIFYLMIRRRLILPIVKLDQYSKTIAMGDFGHSIEVGYNDEVGNLSTAINSVSQGMESKSIFVSEIGKANLNVELTPLSEKDSMAYALIDMRENLLKISIEESKRNWTTEGLAKFGELLRRKGSLQEVFDNVLKELVRYMKVNQGGLFITTNDGTADTYMEMLSCYAWGKKKFFNKKIYPGEGMIGEAWLEKEIVYLKEVPSDYILIRSGLGEALPRAVIIVPLKTNNEILGIIELASFNEIEAHEQIFLATIAENIASVLSTLKIADRTRILLEQSQQNAEELRSQEEEMRQNMEELTATQEEMQRKGKETENRIKAIDDSGIISVEFEMDGTISDANENFINLMGYSLSEIKGKHHRIFVAKDFAYSEEYEQFWRDLQRGFAQSSQFKRVVKSGRIVYIKGCYSIIKDANNTPTKILNLGIDITNLVVEGN
jgi:PAS domain S-box-containing protein